MTSILFVSATREEAAHLPEGADLLITGIGTMAATMHLTRELSRRSELPGRILNIGTAGALRDGMGGVYEVEHAFKHDFNSELIAEMTGRPCPNGIDLELSTHLPAARLATGDSFISDSATRNRLATRASLCDMEGVAVVGVAKHFGVPVTLLKQVSDSADENAATTWYDAVDAGARQLVTALEELDLLRV